MKPRTQPLRKQRKGESAALTRKLDLAWAGAVKRIGYCEWCGRSGLRLEAHHHIGRSEFKLRFELRNGFCLCFLCHNRVKTDPEKYTDWVRSHRPDDLAYVRKLEQADSFNWTIPQKREKLAQLKEMLAELRSLSQDSDEREAAA